MIHQFHLNSRVLEKKKLTRLDIRITVHALLKEKEIGIICVRVIYNVKSWNLNSN